MLSTVLYYELAMKVPIPVGITVYLLTWGLGHLRCLVFDMQGVSEASKSWGRQISGQPNDTLPPPRHLTWGGAWPPCSDTLNKLFFLQYDREDRFTRILQVKAKAV